VRALLRQLEIVVGTWLAARAEAPHVTEREVRDALRRLDPLWDDLFPADEAWGRTQAAPEGPRTARRRSPLGPVTRDVQWWAETICRKGRGMCLSEEAGHHRADEPFLPDLLAGASHVLVQGFAQELRRRGTSLLVWRVMAALCVEPRQTVSALAEASLLQQPTMTKLLDRMARAGLVARAPDACDRRVVRVVLTPEGKAKAAELMAAAEHYEAQILARHPQAEEIRAVLREIIARFGTAPRARGGGGA
jgi:DNA-binding MarR family transcriptional regulator